MTLSRYRAKRDFQTTSEPRGGRAKKGWLYLVQKHAARQLHYDFRLQIGSTLKSWAVPKGPSLDPKVRRLAMHVEDHPVEYGSFEGTIPAGQYGAGTVMLWDTGSWEIEGDAEQQYRQGKLHFTLHGEKLRGEWVLVRRSGTAEGEGKEPWFLFKVRDDEAVEGDEAGILDREPNSAKTGRSLDEITSGKSRVWNSGRKASTASNGRSATVAVKRAPSATSHGSRKQLLAKLSGTKQAAMPAKIKPQLATLVKQAPAGDEWLNEIKFDGYRMICRIEPRSVQFVSRNGLDWTHRLEQLVKAVRGMGIGSAVLDGEVVALEEDGRSSFQSLQNAFSGESSPQLVYYVFDVLYLDGTSLVKAPLEERKQVLAAIVGAAQGPVRDAGYIVGKGPEFFEEAGRRGLEGIICKRRDRPYRPGRSADWLKVKCGHREEFVIGGYTDPSGSRVGFGALLLGYHNDAGELVYCGRVGTGFGDKLLANLSKRLKKMSQDESPFVDLQGRTGEARGAHWVKPELVAQVAFGDWTHDRHLRHPSFQGLREDKKAGEVTREQAVPLKAIAKEAKATNTKKKSSGRSAKPAAATNGGNSEILASVRLTHPDKVLYPEDGITKAQLAGYYAQVADWILPHIENRPLTLVRCPAGYHKQCFYQKHAEKGMPEALGRITIAEKRQKITYATVHDIEGLLSLVHMNVLEIHIWGSRTDSIERPDRLVFDLDPDEGLPWKRVVESARQLRAFFEELGLTAFLKTTGGKGLHLVLPIERRTDWDEAKEICRAIAESVTRADPDRYTTNMSKAARGGKIFIDYLRNGRSATSVAAYSTRARAGCPVSTPIAWEELPTLKSASQYTLANVPGRLDALKRDPWQDIASTKQSLSKSLLKKLNGTG